ncbi:hypothetical protein ACQK5W_03155 [Pantoea sp. FN060301]|uniref:hypothetical protein n=1 Tax=Pantoea sp. FN060301 TaxID=3420380 RepID=UPI003D1690FB
MPEKNGIQQEQVEQDSDDKRFLHCVALVKKWRVSDRQVLSSACVGNASGRC